LLCLLVRLDLRCSRDGCCSLEELSFASSSAAAPALVGRGGGAIDRFEASCMDLVCVEQSGICFILLLCHWLRDCNDVKGFVLLQRGL
jgi:hypothetical protein